MSRLLVIAVAVVIATAVRADPIVVLSSWHNLDFAKNACEKTLATADISKDSIRWVLANPSAYDPDDVKFYKTLSDGSYECRMARDARTLGRKLESEVLNLLAVSPRCRGVTVFIEGDENYDGRIDATIADVKKWNDHWDLHLDYVPGSKVHGWWLFPSCAGNKGGGFNLRGPVISGEGATAMIADQVCVVVTGQGATVR
jgi:hypothetical protein